MTRKVRRSECKSIYIYVLKVYLYIYLLKLSKLQDIVNNTKLLEIDWGIIKKKFLNLKNHK